LTYVEFEVYVQLADRIIAERKKQKPGEVA